jgi:glyoxylase-like metal-dependent hydrolase (beta-lactamase superfamily II)
MTYAMDLSRRSFLVHASRGTIALAVLSVAGCGPTALSSRGPSASSAGASAAGGGSSAGSGAAGSAGASGGSAAEPPSSAAGGVTWQRANLGFVSAYVLVRAGEAVIVDTGVAGSEAAIHQAITAAGLDWGQVGHVILTHKHADHAGSIGAVLSAATAATGYAGEADLPSITSPRPLTSVKDGDMVFGLRIVATPGHTIGHVAVLDEAGGILVAGDALRTASGTLEGSNPSFTEDAGQAKATVAKLGRLTFETLLVGHGEPILEGASAQVAALAAGS